MKKVLKIFGWAVLLFALIQLIPIDRTNPPLEGKHNFVEVMNTPTEVRQLLKTSCYDCHSNETVYPSYAYVAPISWSVKHHINKGRRHLNFSEWGTYNRELKEGMLKNGIGDLEENRMPLAGYVAQHPEARLTKAQKKLLIDYFQKVLDSLK
ncbi:heme-binding domain-containing protein [Bergeyella porcorum]|uniref:heme-binding domain-containing protein n=1 Tax=Bergeyella porcorum TaxID=1735111 RepID=UPI0035EF4F97